MKKIIVKILSILAIGVMNTSCLDFEPQTQLSDGDVWNSVRDFELFANQFYNWTRDFKDVIGDGIHSDFRSDILTTPSGNNMFSAGNVQIPATDDNYTTLYKRIRYCNLLLEKATEYRGEGIERYIAEAKFFRAYSYFELVQMYGNVILTVHPLDLDSQEMRAPRSDRGEVIDQVVKDLEEAAFELPLVDVAEGRISKGAAQAFLSRVALYEGTWQKFHNNNTTRANMLLTKAANAAKQVINSKKYELFYSPILGDMSYKYMFILEDVKSNPQGLIKTDNKEYILVTRHDQIIKSIGLDVTHATLANTAAITRKFVNMYLCCDGLPISKSRLFQGYDTALSEFQNRDNRMKNTMCYHNQRVWNNLPTTCRVDWTGGVLDIAHSTTVTALKGSGYQNQKWATEREVADRLEGYDYPVIRYAEVLLNYAEAQYELSESITDADLDLSLNLVRQRINKTMPKLSNSFVSSNGLDMREEIRRERTIELFYEGFRIDDLKRWATAKNEMPQDLLGIKWIGTEFQTIWSTDAQPRNSEGIRVMQTNRVFEDKHYLLPLPSDQCQLNPSLGQNDGWY